MGISMPLWWSRMDPANYLDKDCHQDQITTTTNESFALKHTNCQKSKLWRLSKRDILARLGDGHNSERRVRHRPWHDF